MTKKKRSEVKTTEPSSIPRRFLTVKCCINFGVLDGLLAQLDPDHLLHPLEPPTRNRSGKLSKSVEPFCTLSDRMAIKRLFALSGL